LEPLVNVLQSPDEVVADALLGRVFPQLGVEGLRGLLFGKPAFAQVRERLGVLRQGADGFGDEVRVGDFVPVCPDRDFFGHLERPPRKLVWLSECSPGAGGLDLLQSPGSEVRPVFGERGFDVQAAAEAEVCARPVALVELRTRLAAVRGPERLSVRNYAPIELRGFVEACLSEGEPAGAGHFGDSVEQLGLFFDRVSPV
jgi:hypothetical protein